MNKNKHFILLVEDNPDDVELILRSFKKNNIANKIKVAYDGAEALDFLFGKGEYAGREAKDMPAVVLLDFKLPKIDGLEVLKRLRADAKTKLLPVVMFTSSKEDQDIINSYKAGCNSYVHKPISFDEFSEVVRQMGLYWLILNEQPQ